jgi:putative toxin-antitoxin system antitoxin component (TIGR02293 family)
MMTIIPPPCFSPFAGLPMDSARAIRNGVAANLVEDVAKFLRVRREILCEYLRLDATSIDLRIASNELLLSWEAGRIYLVYKILLRAQDVFEVEYGAVNWITGMIPALGGVTPLSLLDTPAGFELVIDTLGQLAYGVCA